MNLFAQNVIINQRYRIVAILGRSRFNEIYLAYDHTSKNQVIIKVTEDEAAFNLSLNEFNILKKINHPGIVKASDFFKISVPKQQYCVVLEYVEGKSLEDIIDEGLISIHQGINITKQLLEIIAELENHRLIHRDLKPSNIMIESKSDRVCLIDFNIATDEKSSIIDLVGTLRYAPPEVFHQPPHAWSISDDLYSAGVIFYEMFTGQIPATYFTKDNTVRHPCELRSDLPKVIGDSILRAISLDPSKRFNSASDWLTIIKHYLTSTDEELEKSDKSNSIYINADILIVTKLEVEKNAVLEVFLDGGISWKRRYINNSTYYSFGDSAGVETFMVQIEMGEKSTFSIKKAIEDLHPKSIIITGLAVGKNPTEQHLGDILISDQIYTTNLYKIDKKDKFVPLDLRMQASPFLLNIFYKADVTWTGAKVHYGVILSPEGVIDQHSLKQLFNIERKAIGAEIEGFRESIVANDAKVNWIFLKGVCDWGDGIKNDKAQELAADNAASFLLHVIRQYSLFSFTKSTKQDRLIQFRSHQNNNEVSISQLILKQLTEDLYRVLTNVLITFPSGYSYEYDLIVLGPNSIFVIEVKDWRGKFSGDNEVWILNQRKMVSPIKQIRLKANNLSKLLRTRRIGPRNIDIKPVVCLIGSEEPDLSALDILPEDQKIVCWDKHLSKYLSSKTFPDNPYSLLKYHTEIVEGIKNISSQRRLENENIKNAVIKVINDRNQVIGAGFFIDKNIIVTCAHLINVLQNGQPVSQVSLLLKNNRLVQAKVLNILEKEDIAFLELVDDPPSGITQLPIDKSINSIGNIFLSYGFPRVAVKEGVFVSGEIKGYVNTEYGSEELQLHSPQIDYGFNGFSGAPVLDQSTGLVIGIISTLRRDKSIRDIAYAIPGERIISAFKNLDFPDINQLETPFQAPPLPPNYIPRPEVSQGLIDDLLSEKATQTSTTKISAVLGLGGIGKTTLVAALVHDPIIREHFSGGVLWTTLGEDPDLLSILNKWIKALGGDEFVPIDLNKATTHLQILLKNKVCLLVLDDVWKVEHVKPFLGGGSACRILITSRDYSIARDLGSRQFHLDGFTEAQALAFFEARLGILGVNTNKARELTRELGFLPLALELAAILLSNGIKWNTILNNLRPQYSDSVAANSYAFDTLRSVFGRSIDRLTLKDQQAFFSLGALRKEARLTLSQVSFFWSTPKRDARKRLNRLADMCLVSRISDDEYTIHPLVYEEARLRLTEIIPLEQANAELLKHYADKIPKDIDGKPIWNEGPHDGYFFESLAFHLFHSGQTSDLRSLLLDYRWIQAKIQATDIDALVADYDFLKGDESLKQVQDGLIAAKEILSSDKSRTAEQLINNLQPITPDIQNLIQQISPKYKHWANPFAQLIAAPYDSDQYLFERPVFKKIIGIIQNFGSVWLLGGYGIGKTTLLYHLVNTRPEWVPTTDTRVIYFDCSIASTESDFYGQLIKQLGGTGQGENGFRQTVSKFPTVILLDEVGLLSDFGDRFFMGLRNLASTTRLSLIFASTKLPSELSRIKDVSPFTNFFYQLELPTFTREEFKNYIENRLSMTQVSFTDHEIDELIKQSDGFPRKLNLLASELYSQKLNLIELTSEKSQTAISITTSKNEIEVDQIMNLKIQINLQESQRVQKNVFGEISLSIQADGFYLPDGMNIVTISLTSNEVDTEVELIAQDPGEHLVSIIPYYQGKRLASVSRKIRVTPSHKPKKLFSDPLSPRPVPHPDLCIRVYSRSESVEDNLITLDYFLYSPHPSLLLPGTPAGSISVKETDLSRIMGRLDQVLQNRGEESEVFSETLSAVGKSLFDLIIPDHLKEIYIDIYNKVKSILIISDVNPWIPWELLKPHGAQWEHDFLASYYQLGHWIDGLGALRRPEFPLGQVNLVQGPGVAVFHPSTDWCELFSEQDMQRLKHRIFRQWSGGFAAAMSYETPVWGLHLETQSERLGIFSKEIIPLDDG